MKTSLRKSFLTISALLSATLLMAQKSFTIKDSCATVDKWASGASAGIFVDGGAANVKAVATDAPAGVFSAKIKGLKQASKLLVYAPYCEGAAIDAKGRIKMSVPSVQDGKCPAVYAGITSPASLKEAIVCDIAPRTACFLLKISSKNATYNSWRLDKITVVTESGKITGEAYLDSRKGRLSPGKEVCGTVSYVPSEETHLSESYKYIPLKVIPCKGLHGTKFRVEYTFSKDGRTAVLCHDLVGMEIHQGYTYTLEERIPAVIAGRWHFSDFPGEDWEVVKPEAMGYSSAKLEQLRKYITDSLTTTSMMVIVGGKVIFTMGDVAEPVRIASCRKSLLSMLYGKYVENGTINLDATLEELGIDDKGGLLPIEKQAKVRHLITARSGVYHPASNDGDDLKYAPARGSVQPGTYHLYNNWDFNCAGGVFEKLTGKDIYDAFMEDIAIPTGMQDYKIDNQHKTGITDPTMSNFLAYHFWLSTRDMARVAYLMLHKGNWNGTQVISEDWVKTTTSVVTPRSEMNPPSRHKREFEYGYLWWIFCKDFKGYDPAVYADGYTATGSGGQYMTVLPALDMVIAHKDKSESTNKSTYYKLLARIAACKE